MHQKKSLARPGHNLSFFIALLSLLLVAPSDAADFKLADGCLVFDYDAGSPDMKTSYSWSGACDADGYASGKGELKAYRNGGLDEDSTGSLKRGRLEDTAVTTNLQGARFTGSYQDGMREGYGVLTGHGHGGMGFRYEGNFHHGVPEGIGVETLADGRIYQGSFSGNALNGQGVETGTTEQGISFRYDGVFVQGQWSGHGLLRWSNGESAEGEFASGRMIGKGNVVRASVLQGQSASTLNLPSLILSDER